jgi:hypothetical protein
MPISLDTGNGTREQAAEIHNNNQFFTNKGH